MHKSLIYHKSSQHFCCGFCSFCFLFQLEKKKISRRREALNRITPNLALFSEIFIEKTNRLHVYSGGAPSEERIATVKANVADIPKLSVPKSSQ